MAWASKNGGVHTAYDDGVVELTASGIGVGTTGAAGACVVVEDDGESNDSLGDGRWECNGNTGLPRLDVNAASADTEAGRNMGPASSEAGRASTLE